MIHRPTLILALFGASLAFLLITGVKAQAFTVVGIHLHAEDVAQTSNFRWRQVNVDGFGDSRNRAINSLEPFGGYLYAGTFNSLAGAELWRSADGVAWSPVVTAGLVSTYVTGIEDLVEFSGYLYASTSADITYGLPEIWRSSNGLDWTRVVTNGLDNMDNSNIVEMAVFSNTLYAGTCSGSNTGAEIWRTADGLTWQQDVAGGFGLDNEMQCIGAFHDFDGDLYAGTSGATNGSTIWRNDGITWTAVMTDGFGTVYNSYITSLLTFDNQLYAYARNPWAGIEIWRTVSGVTWTPVITGGLGNPDNFGVGGMVEFDGQLYVFTGNGASGSEVWRTSDGVIWEQVGFGGWDDPNNHSTHLDNSIAVFNNRLFAGTVNSSTGGEVWLYLPKLTYLPVIMQ